VTYAPALRNQFVWDDQALILRDPLIRSWRLIWEGFQHFLFTDASGSNFYRPLQRLSYTLDYAIFFNSPLGYHLASILWHAAVGIALFIFACEFLRSCKWNEKRRRWIAFLAALVWVIHPVQSAAVVYVSGRADPLAACFGFFGLFLTLRMFRGTETTKWLAGFGAALSFLASALSKEMGLIFLLLGFLLALFEGGRRPLLGASSLAVCVLAAYLSLRLPAEHFPSPQSPLMPPLVRSVVAARAVAEYTGLLIFPRTLRMERDVETHPFGFVPASMDDASWRELQTLLGLILIALAFYTTWRMRLRREIFWPLLLAFVSYLPVSGIVSLNANVAEHWLYLSSAFLFLGGVVGLSSLGRKFPFVCLTIWILFLSVRTFARTFDWRDERTLFSRTIADGGDSARMLINLGGLELNEGHLEAALQALDRALQKEPNNALAQLDLAAVKIKQRDFPGARALLNKITHPEALRAKAEEAIAVLESRETGMINLMRLRLAARLGPPNWEIEKRYIKALADGGFPERAISELKTCLTIAPYRAESWLMMSELLRKMSRPDESAIAFAAAEERDIHLHARLAARL
jgi:tetratricopeptide (TPR) repeat protein